MKEAALAEPTAVALHAVGYKTLKYHLSGFIKFKRSPQSDSFKNLVKSMHDYIALHGCI